MSGRLLARTGEGVLQEFALGGVLRIGSDPPSEVQLEGTGVLPVHARTGTDDTGAWIEAVGDARIAVNGERSGRRTLRHLDVITIGDSVHVIFSTSAAPLPQQVRPKKAAAPAAAPPAGATRMVSRAAIAAMFKPADGTVAAATPNTMVGRSPAGVVPFKPDAPQDPRNTRLGIGPAGVVPFTPEDATDPRDTRVGIPPAATVPFTPQAEAPADLPTMLSEPAPTVILPARKERPITGVRLVTADAVYEAGTGRSTIGRGVQAAIRIPDKQISRIHALIDVTPSSVTVEDQESVNGTKVNGTRIEGRQVLAEGDVVTLGDFELRVDFVRLGGN